MPPGKIAVIVLAVLRHDQRLADMAGGNGVSESTVRRRRDELLGLLATQAPRLDRALRRGAKQGGEVVLIDGTLIRTGRRTGRADRRNHSGKHRSHGLHFLALTDERGRLIWISAARPSRTHDNTAARHDRILDHLRAAGLGALADLGFRGLDNETLAPVTVTGYTASRTHKLTPGQKEANRALPSDAHRSSTASPTSRTGGSSPSSVAIPPAPPALASLTRPDEPRSQPLTDDLHRRLPPTTSTSTPRTDHTSPVGCRLAAGCGRCAAPHSGLPPPRAAARDARQACTHPAGVQLRARTGKLRALSAPRRCRQLARPADRSGSGG